MTPDIHLDRPLGSPLALHKRQVDPLDTSTETVEFWHRHSELVRLILQLGATDGTGGTVSAEGPRSR